MAADVQRCCWDYVYTSAGELCPGDLDNGEDKLARNPLLYLGPPPLQVVEWVNGVEVRRGGGLSPLSRQMGHPTIPVHSTPSSRGVDVSAAVRALQSPSATFIKRD